jgi:hypothetical protein
MTALAARESAEAGGPETGALIDDKRAAVPVKNFQQAVDTMKVNSLIGKKYVVPGAYRDQRLTFTLNIGASGGAARPSLILTRMRR